MFSIRVWFATALAALAFPSCAPAASAEDGWLSYSDGLGISFRYPPELRIVDLDAPAFGIEGLAKALQLVSGDKDKIVLRILVASDERPRGFRDDEAFLGQACKSHSRIILSSGEAAINCVDCGKGACHWWVHLFGGWHVTMFTLLADEAQEPSPRDGDFPLLQIIRSVRVVTRDQRQRAAP